jgi:hypothetical protein
MVRRQSGGDARDKLAQVRSVCDWAQSELDNREREFTSPDAWIAASSRRSFDWLTKQVHRAMDGSAKLSLLRTLRTRYESHRVTWALVEAVDAVKRHFARHENDLDVDAEYDGPVPVARHRWLRRRAAAESCVQLVYLRRKASTESEAERLALDAQRATERFIRTSEAGRDAQTTRWLRGEPVGDQTTRVCDLLDNEPALRRRVPSSYTTSKTKGAHALALAMVSAVIGEGFESLKKKYTAQPKRPVARSPARARQRRKRSGTESAK